MLHFAFAEIVQERSPLFVSLEILGDMFGKENVASGERPGLTPQPPHAVR
jgi:hypothetical protein